MDNWKPVATKIMQKFQDFDNEGVDVSKCLFDVVQNSKLRFLTCREIFLFGLNFTDSSSATYWASRTIQNYPTIPLSATFEELLKVPMDKPYNFLMSLDKDSINKEISRLGVETLMFWELPKVENALHEMCQKWFYNDCGAVIKGPIQQTTPPVVTESVPELTIEIVGSCKEKEQCIELGSVEKLVELWRLRRKNLEAKAEIAVTAFLAQYTHKAGETLMNKLMSYKSFYMF